MNCPIILVPAYGRKYATEDEIIMDYVAGKDFKIHRGPYCSCRDFPGEEVYLHYGPGIYVAYTI